MAKTARKSKPAESATAAVLSPESHITLKGNHASGKSGEPETRAAIVSMGELAKTSAAPASAVTAARALPPGIRDPAALLASPSSRQREIPRRAARVPEHQR